MGEFVYIDNPAGSIAGELGHSLSKQQARPTASWTATAWDLPSLRRMVSPSRGLRKDRLSGGRTASGSGKDDVLGKMV
jgi:hypothetical protein